MRKVEKENLFNIIKLMDEACVMLRQSIENSDDTAAFSVLQSLQDTAVNVGTAIENAEGVGHVTVGRLEAFCENVYQVSEVLQVERADAAKRAEALAKDLQGIRESLEKDVKVRREVVFLPYKASMWDSLESIWLEADKDPDCDAYVIPIPYYDKNPDGSAKTMHYEADQYPAYVPITKYDEYAFEKRRPDMMFIINPYDDCNYVTSVLPYFYSEHLREMTDCLVYVPYFILQEPDRNDPDWNDHIKHFVTVPGVCNAHYVIVQSEEMRKSYVDILIEKFGEENREIIEKKILGLGSPKVDKVLGTTKENVTIPDEWLSLMQKSDGTFKKVVLYNTGLSAYLQNNEKMLTKIENTLQVFKGFCNDVTLLWRPHPLLSATIESMRPDLKDDYDKLVSRYREEAWGIFDDTADMERAVGISDAYYGDVSSVGELYVKSGKPVMIQNCDVLPEPKPCSNNSERRTVKLSKAKDETEDTKSDYCSQQDDGFGKRIYTYLQTVII